MESTEYRAFSCSCGKKYKWKPTIAGKRLKCACGSVVTVPTAAPPDEPLYKMNAGAAALATPAPARIVHRRSKLSSEFAGASSNDGKSKGSSRGGLTDPIRDTYVPAALLIIGLLAVLVWAAVQPHTSSSAVIGVWILAEIQTFIKTAVIVGLALLFSSQIGISFGLLHIAIRKFGAILIFSDAALLWLEEFFKAVGGISHSGQTVIWFLLVMLGCTTTVISILSFYLFNMDLEDIATFAIPMALVSKLIGYLLWLVVSAMMAASNSAATSLSPVTIAPTPSIEASRPPIGRRVIPPPPTTPAPAPAAAPAPVATANTSVDMTPVTVVPTITDQIISKEISGRFPLLPDARLWKQKRGLTDPRTSSLLDELYTAGAAHIYLRMQMAPKGTVGPLTVPGSVIIELPAFQGPRQACLDAAASYLTDSGDDLGATTQPSTDQYLIVKLKH